MDNLDYKILKLVMENSRIAWSDIAAQVGLSAPAVTERYNRLVQQGVIEEVTLKVNAELVGNECMAFVAVTLEKPIYREAFLQKIEALEEVQECHHIAGDADYFVKICCRNTKDLDRIISYELKGIDGILNTKTTIVMNTLKETMQTKLQHHVFHMK